MSLKGSKTEENLKEAFAGESQANRRYTVFGKVIKGMEFIDKIKKGEGPNGSVKSPDKIISLKLK